MLKRFTGRTVSNPILLVLVKVQHSFQYRNQNAETARDQHHSRKTERRQEWDYCRSRNLNHLYSFEVSLVDHTFSVIPTNLIFESVHNGIDFSCVRGFSAHSLPILPRTCDLGFANFARDSL